MHSWDQAFDLVIPHSYLSLTIVDWVPFFDMDTRGAPPPSHALDTPLPITLAETFAATDCPGQRREAALTQWLARSPAYRVVVAAVSH